MHKTRVFWSFLMKKVNFLENYHKKFLLEPSSTKNFSSKKIIATFVPIKIFYDSSPKNLLFSLKKTKKHVFYAF
jgi:hypothetical protein